jgi:hypothetical protein
MSGAGKGVLVSSRIAALLLALAACEPVISRSSAIEGKACSRAAELCLPGYTCRAEVCVPVGAAGEQSAAAGSSSRLDSNVDVPALDPEPSETGGSGGAPSSDFSGDGDAPVGSAGAGATMPAAPSGGGAAGAAAAPDAGPARDDGCVEQMLFRDRDGDGFGNNSEQSFGCPAPGWVARGGDCHDVVAGTFDRPEDVHPEQTAYFFVGYPDPTKPRGISFDYDCSRLEEADPSNTPIGLAPDCAQLGDSCAGSGFVPDERGGPGTDSRCGSEIVRSCSPSGPGQCSSFENATDQVFRCR